MPSGARSSPSHGHFGVFARVVRAATGRRGLIVLIVCSLLFLLTRSPVMRLFPSRRASRSLQAALPPSMGGKNGDEMYRSYGPIDADTGTVALLSWYPERPAADELKLVDRLAERSPDDPGIAATLDPPAWSPASPTAACANGLHEDFSYAFTAAARDAVVQSPAASSALAVELKRRLTIGLGMGIHSGNLRVWLWGVDILPVLATLLPSFLPTAQPNHVYRFYLAFDAVDPIFGDASIRQRVEAAAQELFAAEDARRWHPEGYVPGRTVDGSTLLMSIHWVRCEYAGKPAWAHSDAIMAAFREGADYAFRTNDDTAFPAQPDWADRFIADLRSRSPVPNLGVVGPSCGRGNTDILTHDFVHRTHAAIFNFHYPRSLPDWSSDDWITRVYERFDKPLQLTVVRPDVVVEHTMSEGQRYKQQAQATRLINLNREVREGASAITSWVASKYPGTNLTYTVAELTCC